MNFPRIVTAQEAEVKQASDNIRDFKAGWEYTQRVLYNEQLDALEYHRNQAVVAAFLAGSNKSAILRAMGTSNRHAVYEILKSETHYHEELHSKDFANMEEQDK